MRKPLREMSVMELGIATENNGLVYCPEGSNSSSCLHGAYDVEYAELGKLIRWPDCEDCDCSLVIQWVG